MSSRLSSALSRPTNSVPFSRPQTLPAGWNQHANVGQWMSLENFQIYWFSCITWFWTFIFVFLSNFSSIESLVTTSTMVSSYSWSLETWLALRGPLIVKRVSSFIILMTYSPSFEQNNKCLAKSLSHVFQFLAHTTCLFPWLFSGRSEGYHPLFTFPGPKRLSIQRLLVSIKCTPAKEKTCKQGFQFLPWCLTLVSIIFDPFK